MAGILKSLTGRTLLYITVGMTAIIAAATTASYRLTFGEFEQNLQSQLLDQTTRAGHRQQERFVLARDAQESLKARVLEQLMKPAPYDVDARFDALFMRYPDGAIRNRPAYGDGRVHATLWAPRSAVDDALFRRLFVHFYDICQQYGPLLRVRFFNFWFVTPNGANIAYDPERPDWVYDAAADYNPTAQEWVALGSPARNPNRATVWAGPELDPVGNTYEISGVTPIDLDGRHVASMGSGMSYDSLVADLTESEIPSSTQVLFREDGRLIAHSERNADILAANGTLTVADARDARLTELWADALAAATLPTVGYNAVTDHYFAVARLEATQWLTATLVPGQIVRAQAFQASRWVLWTGLLSLGLLLALLATILQRQIARPLQHVVAAAQRLTRGELDVRVANTGPDEIARLAEGFNAMAEHVQERDAQLRVEKSGLQQTLTTLRATEERFRALIEHAADIICVVDAEGRMLYLSPSFERILGYQAGEWIGHSSFELIHPDDHAAIIAAQMATAENPERPIGPLEYRIRHRDGRWRCFETTGSNQLGNPAVNGIVINARDISEQKHATEQLEKQRDVLHQTEKLSAMGSLLAGVAHELNNPLSVVIGRAAMIEAEASDEAIRASAGKLRASAERCSRIVKTFLAMARQHQPRRASVELNRLIEAALDMTSYGMRSHGIRVELDLSPDLPSANVDPDQIHQVLMNLLINAQQALAEQPGERVIRVTTRDAEDLGAVCVELSDTGPGIPEALRSRIFEPFFTTKAVGAGTGMGLSVSLGIVEAHGGTLRCSQAPSGGARFTIILPIGAAANPEPQQIPAAPPLDGERRVLVVDDEPEIVAMLSETLERRGYRVTGAPKMAAAQAALTTEHFDLVLTDLRLPDGDGEQLFVLIRKQYPALAKAVVFMTGDTLGSHTARLRKRTGRPCLEKPFTPDEALRVISDTLQTTEGLAHAQR